MTKNFKFKVDDKVQFTAADCGSPALRDMAFACDIGDIDPNYKAGQVNTGEIIKCPYPSDKTHYLVKYKRFDGRVDHFYAYKNPTFGSVEAEELWLRPVQDEQKQAVSAAIWTETIKVNPRQEVPKFVMEAAIDRGERGVRRIGREWPYGKKLVNNIVRKSGDGQDTVEINWFWE